MNRQSQRAHIPSRRGFESGPYLEKLLAELDRAEISARLKAARGEAGLTQPEAGDVLQVHWRTVQTWEDPKGPVPWDRLDEIARAYGVTRDWLLHGDEAPAAPDEISALRSEVAQVRAAVDRVLALLLEAGGSQAGRERP